MPALKKRLIAASRQWFCEIIFNELDAKYGCYIGKYNVDKGKLKLFGTKVPNIFKLMLDRVLPLNFSTVHGLENVLNPLGCYERQV